MGQTCSQITSVRARELYVDGKWIPTLHDIGWIVAAAFAFFASTIAFWLIWMHAAYYHKPHEQRHIVRILLMIPVYSIISFLSYIYYPWAMVYNTISTSYEAFALYSFFLLLRTYLDPNVQELKHDLQYRTITYWVWPLSYDCVKRWCKLSPMNGLTWYWIMLFGISQYAILRPLCSILSIILEHFHLYCEITLSPAFGNFYVFLIQSLSVAVAMYCVVAFWQELKEGPALKKNKPFQKLTCIKLVVFLVFWQSIVFQLLAVAGVIRDQDRYWSARDIQTGLNALAVCVEMAIFAVMHIFAYTYRDYMPEDHTKVTQRWKLIVDAFNCWDMLKDFYKAVKWLFVGRTRVDQKLQDLTKAEGLYSHFNMMPMQSATRISKVDSDHPKAAHAAQTALPRKAVLLSPLLSPLSIALRFPEVTTEDTPKYEGPPPRLRVLTTRCRSESAKGKLEVKSPSAGISGT